MRELELQGVAAGFVSGNGRDLGEVEILLLVAGFGSEGGNSGRGPLCSLVSNVVCISSGGGTMLVFDSFVLSCCGFGGCTVIGSVAISSCCTSCCSAIVC